MKYFFRLLFVGVSPAVFFGCANGPSMSKIPYTTGQTIHFAGTILSHDVIPTYDGGKEKAPMPNLLEDASLQQCLLYGSLQAPELESAFYTWKASLSRIPQVSALADPKVSFGYFIQEIQTRTGPMEQQLSLTQSFPWWGLLDAKGDVATALAQVKWHEYEMKRLTLFEKIVNQWASLVDLNQEIEVVEQSFELLFETERLARLGYEVDTTSHDKLIRLQVELGKLEDKLIQLRNLKNPRIASLNATLARKSDAAFALPKTISLSLSGITHKEAMRLMVNNPLVQAQNESINAQALAIKVAELDAKPKWTAGVTYTNLGDPLDPSTPDAGSNPIMGVIGFTIPLNQTKYDAAKEEALAKQLAAIAAKKSLLHKLQEAISEAMYQRDDALRSIAFYETALIPRAEDALSTAVAAFSAGQTQAIELLDSQRTLLELQRNLQRSYVVALQADAAISRIVGGAVTLEKTK
ncbi:MAG: TolC family protein [Planctomycetes bacterium]|nr:TolC family protein [Planctomycetota bacterium]